jgi:hypothetical protein
MLLFRVMGWPVVGVAADDRWERGLAVGPDYDRRGLRRIRKCRFWREI